MESAMFYWTKYANSVHSMLLSAILILVVYLLWNRRTRANLPHGPPGLPIIGNLHQLKSPAYLTYDKLFKQYGDIFYFRLGQRPAVYINSAEILKNCYTQNIFSGRMKSSFINQFTRDSGVVFTEGEKWMFHRRLSLKIFRDLGMGKSLSESFVRQEAIELCQYLDDFLLASPDGLIDTSNVFSCATMNVISMLLFSERPGYENDEFNNLMENIHYLANDQSFFSNLPIVFPILDVFRPIYNLSKFTRKINASHEMVLKQLETHRQRTSSIETSEPSNYVEAFYAAKKENERKMPQDWMNVYFKDWQILRLTFEFYGAGMDTSSTTLCWSVILLSLHNSVRKRMVEEIHNVIGKDKIVSMEDRKHFQYSLAVIDEIMRFSSIAPITIHNTMEDTKINEYDIPKDFIVVGNLYSIHHDPNIWEKPNEFYPQHFLSEDGTRYCPREQFIPFGIGKRSCLGESLARIEIFIFIITLVQRYQFHVRFDHEKQESLEKCLTGTDGIVRAPGPHTIKLSKC